MALLIACGVVRLTIVVRWAVSFGNAELSSADGMTEEESFVR